MSGENIHTEYFSYLGKQNCSCGLKQVEVFLFESYPGRGPCTKDTFCFICFEETVYPPLVEHAIPCGCVFEFQGRARGCVLPDWLVPPPQHCAKGEHHGT